MTQIIMLLFVATERKPLVTLQLDYILWNVLEWRCHLLQMRFDFNTINMLSKYCVICSWNVMIVKSTQTHSQLSVYFSHLSKHIHLDRFETCWVKVVAWYKDNHFYFTFHKAQLKPESTLQNVHTNCHPKHPTRLIAL